MFERVQGLPLLLRAIAVGVEDALIRELLLCAARQIEDLEERVSHTEKMEQKDV